MKKGSTYELLDSGGFQKLESVGGFRFVRPSPSAVWEPDLAAKEWKTYDAFFERHSDGDGEWKVKNPKVKEPWMIEIEGVRFKMKLTSFGHLGIFPEQKKNWLQMRELVQARKKAAPAFKVLNLFAYTGGSTMFCAQGGAEVTHVDASKGSVNWARENAAASGLEKAPIRWLVDDVQEFVRREIRRGNKYQGLILDPPSYGRGPNKEIWDIEKHLMPFLRELEKLLADDFVFILLSCHSPGYTPTALENQLRQITEGHRGSFISEEMLIEQEEQKPLPSGCSSLFVKA
jgi:23S rRNA (cytosine1962-C5)-methyltransferase